MERDRAMRALDHGDKVIRVVRAYVSQLEKQLDKTMRERDELQRQLKAHRQSMVRRVYQQTQEEM